MKVGEIWECVESHNHPDFRVCIGDLYKIKSLTSYGNYNGHKNVYRVDLEFVEGINGVGWLASFLFLQIFKKRYDMEKE